MQETFEHYQKSTGFGNEGRVAAALAKWGPNRFVVPLPRFADMLQEQLVAPFFVFQVFCVGLWCLDDYWCALPCGDHSVHASLALLNADVAKNDSSGLLHWPVLPGGLLVRAALRGLPSKHAAHHGTSGLLHRSLLPNDP